MKRVLVLGSFDLLHPGHLNFLKQAAAYGDSLWVAVNSDEFMARYKRPSIMRLKERMDMLRALTFVGEVFPNFGGEDSKTAIIHALKGADELVIVHGDDWVGDDYLRQLDVTKEWLDQRMVTIEYVPYTRGVSTSEILARIADRDMTPFCRCGTMCVGQSVLDDQTEHGIAPRRKCKGLGR